jgi:hypothetical protein
LLNNINDAVTFCQLDTLELSGEGLWVEIWGYIHNPVVFITFNWTQKARVLVVLHFTRAERLAKDKCSSLFGPFVSYEENEVL